MRAGWLVSGFAPVEDLPGWNGSTQDTRCTIRSCQGEVTVLGGTRWTLRSYQGEGTVLGGTRCTLRSCQGEVTVLGGTTWTLRSYQGKETVLGGDKMYLKVLPRWSGNPGEYKMYQLSGPRISAFSHSLIPEKWKMFESRHGKAANKKARNECLTFTQKSHGLSWKLFFLCFPLSEKLSWSNQWYHFWTERNQYALNSQLLWSEATTHFWSKEKGLCLLMCFLLAYTNNT